jgi:hypothetical protein
LENIVTFNETIAFVEAACQLFAKKFELFASKFELFAEKFGDTWRSCEQCGGWSIPDRLGECAAGID